MFKMAKDKRKKAKRDTSGLAKARADPQGTRERVAIAKSMLREGMTFAEIRRQTKARLGVSIGQGTLMRLRDVLKAENKQLKLEIAERQKVEAEAPGPISAPAEYVKTHDTTAVLTAKALFTVDIANLLFAAGVPFTFDGSYIHVERKLMMTASAKVDMGSVTWTKSE